MAETFTYSGNLVVKGWMTKQGVPVADTHYMKYSKVDKIVTRKAIPIHNVRPGMSYYFPDGFIKVRGLTDSDYNLYTDNSQTPDDDKIWRKVENKSNNQARRWAQYKTHLSNGILVHIPYGFDPDKFLSDSEYVMSTTTSLNVGKIKTTSPYIEIWDGHLTYTAPLDLQFERIVVNASFKGTIYEQLSTQVLSDINHQYIISHSYPHRRWWVKYASDKVTPLHKVFGSKRTDKKIITFVNNSGGLDNYSVSHRSLWMPRSTQIHCHYYEIARVKKRYGFRQRWLMSVDKMPVMCVILTTTDGSKTQTNTYIVPNIKLCSLSGML